MQNKDAPEFAKITTAVMANFRSAATEPLLEMWFDMAKEDGITIEQWTASARKILRSRKYTSQPTYADFYEAAWGVDATEVDVASEQAADVMKQVRELGSYRTPFFSDPITKSLMSSRWSWKSVCSMTESEHKWWAKEFIDAYQSLSHIGIQGKVGNDNPRLRLLAGGIGRG